MTQIAGFGLRPIHLILSAGTCIVARNNANRIGSGQLIPTGAVAVITDSPADAQHAYKVRCNDVWEISPRTVFVPPPVPSFARESDERDRTQAKNAACKPLTRSINCEHFDAQR